MGGVVDGYGESVSGAFWGRLGIGRPCSVASAFSAVEEINQRRAT